MNISFLDLLKGAPGWVWLILAFITILGVRLTRPNRVFVMQLFITPLILVLFNMRVFIGSSYLLLYIIELFVCTALGFLYTYLQGPTPILGTLKINLPGSYIPLLIFLQLFVVKFSFGVFATLFPSLIIQWQMVNVLSMALCTGFMLGRGLACIWAIYSRR